MTQSNKLDLEQYWNDIESEITSWHETGFSLHATKVGSFVAGESKKRSFLREQIILSSVPLFVNFRDATVLDIACNDGFWSFRFGGLGIKSLLGIDSNSTFIKRANFLKKIYRYSSFTFESKNLLKFIFNKTEKDFSCDIVLILSILYHLPATTDWYAFFYKLSLIGKTIIIDSRWFDNEEYWYKETFTEDKIHKWRPKKKDIVTILEKAGFQYIIEIDVCSFMINKEEGYGDGDPYSFENIADYITQNRSIIVAYKQKPILPQALSNASFTELVKYN